MLAECPGPIGSFVTAPRADDDAKVTFCFSADTRESYKPFTVMNAVRAQRPDFFMHLGDTIYADRNGTAHTLNEFWAKYRVNRDDAWSAACFRETSLYVSVGRPRSGGQLFAEQSAGADRAPGIFGLLAGPLFCERAASEFIALFDGGERWSFSFSTHASTVT